MTQAIQAFLDLIVGLRKIFIMLTLYSIAIYMDFRGHLSGDQFVNLMKSTTIAFFGANGIEHGCTAAKEIALAWNLLKGKNG